LRRSIAALAALGVSLAATAAATEPAPDALAVEWHGEHPCEKLYEDAQIRVSRCVFPPGAVHLRHQHPGYLTYVLAGGEGQVDYAAGHLTATTRTDQLIASPPVAWHEFKNIGRTTIRYLVIEKKYEPAPAP
jgi:quercetin dioxygenase-like cupin family protein